MRKFKFMRYILLFILIVFAADEICSQQHWFIENSGTTQNLNRVKFISLGNHIAAGDNGTILRSTNNGVLWYSINTGYNYNINDLENTYHILAACDGGHVLKSTNSGNNWISQNTGINFNINSITRLTQIRYFAACDNGTIIKTNNGGTDWSVVSPIAVDLNSITGKYMGTNSFIFAAGDNGIIIRSSDLGNNWISLASGTNKTVNYIYTTFYDSVIYACGENGLVLKTENFGISWLTINTGYNYNYTSMCRIYDNVLQKNKFYLTSSEGKILYSEDTGSTWSMIYDGNVPLNYIDATSSRVAGDIGLILYRYPFPFWNSHKYMDANTISTPYRNDGNFNRNPVTGNLGFEWPIGENKYARLASGIWLGAEVDGDTLIAMAQYASEFFSGYTDNSGNPQGKLDTLYKVYKILGDVNDNDRIKWPNALLGNSDQGAPVYFDQQSNSWKPLDFGAQTMFISFTDSYPESHGNNAGSTLPLKADIKMLNYAFIHPGVLNNTIITRYTIINRSSKIWNNLYIGLWTNDELGDFSDDLLACDTNLNLTYTYNGDNNDVVYGTAPPAVGFLILKGPAAYTGNNNDTSWICNAKERISKIGYKDRKMDIFNCYVNAGSTWGDPMNYIQTYRILNGLGKLGTQIINPITNQPTKYFYSGDPVTGQGWILGSYGSHRSITINGPVNINPGDTQYIVFAQIIARGNSNINSISVLRQYAQEVKNYYNNCFSGVPIGIEPVSNKIPDKFELYQNYPNPFNPKTKIKFSTPKSPKGDLIKIIIYNSLGQEVNTFVNDKMDAGIHKAEFDGSNFASGVYFYSLIVGDNVIDTKKMLLVK